MLLSVAAALSSSGYPDNNMPGLQLEVILIADHLGFFFSSIANQRSVAQSDVLDLPFLFEQLSKNPKVLILQ